MSLPRRGFFRLVTLGTAGMAAQSTLPDFISGTHILGPRALEAVKAFSRVRSAAAATLVNKTLDLMIVERALDKKWVSLEQLGVRPEIFKGIMNHYAGELARTWRSSTRVKRPQINKLESENEMAAASSAEKTSPAVQNSEKVKTRNILRLLMLAEQAWENAKDPEPDMDPVKEFSWFNLYIDDLADAGMDTLSELGISINDYIAVQKKISAIQTAQSLPAVTV